MIKELPKFNYSPWCPPFNYDALGSRIIDSSGQLVIDIRGWGFLTGRAQKGALAMHELDAMKIQDRLGEHLVTLMNNTIK